MHKLFDLTGKVALVTGGTGYIGLAIVKMLLSLGAKVICGSSSSEKVAAAQQALANEYPADSFLVCRLDVTDDTGVKAALAQGLEKFGAIDVLVNCAGINQKKPFLDTSIEEFQTILDVNLLGAVRVTKAVLQQMLKQGHGGTIVNICSIASSQALSGVTAYACAKAGLLALTRQLAVELELITNGIRTVAVVPGFIPAGQNREILQSGDRGQRIQMRTPMERFGMPEEVAGAVAFLCSGAASFINGTCITVDGGFSICGVGEAMSGTLAITGIPNPGDDVTTLVPEGAVDADTVPQRGFHFEPGGAPKPDEISSGEA